MLNIDGSRMEGGGQIVRSAVALSAISGIAVAITNIRAQRTKPGLAAQHVAAVRAVAAACSATCTGLSVGSRHIRFTPHTVEKRYLMIDVGTAGSVTLVIQAWLPVALRTGGTLQIIGETDVQKSPTTDYLDRVYAEVLRRHGARIRIDVERRGYYPVGGGYVRVTVEPASFLHLAGAGAGPCDISSSTSNLPDHVAERQAKAAAAVLPPDMRDSCTIAIDRRTDPSTGSSCTVWRGAKGSSALGRRGLPAERVGEIAARAALCEFDAEGAVDVHLADQLLIFLVQYGGSFTTSTCSTHAGTQCWLLEQFGYRIRCRKNAIVEFRA
jgi:RNA 3'-terminal phosphate cyclase (ATP)